MSAGGTISTIGAERVNVMATAEARALLESGRQAGKLLADDIASALDELDLRLLEEAVQVLDVRLVEVDLRERRGDLGVGQHARCVALGDEELYLLELLKFPYGHPLPVL